MDKKNEHTPKDALTKSRLNDTSLPAQRKRVSAHLKELGSIDRFYAEENLNILSLAARILDLRKLGYKIHTDKIKMCDQHGRPHNNCARYVLIAEPVDGGLQ